MRILTSPLVGRILLLGKPPKFKTFFGQRCLDSGGRSTQNLGTGARLGPIFFFRAMELRQRGLRTEIELHREDLLAVNSFSAPYIVRISSVCVGPQPTGGRGCVSHRACKTRGINSNVRLVVDTCIHLSKIQFRFDTGYTIMLGN